MLHHDADAIECRTCVTLTFTGGVPGPAASIARATSPRLIFNTRLLWSMSLKPSAPYPLEKNTSSVSGTHTGASFANAKSGLAAMERMVAFGPRMSRNSGWKTWKNGGDVRVGLKNSVMASLRKEPLMPRTLNVRGSTSYRR